MLGPRRDTELSKISEKVYPFLGTINHLLVNKYDYLLVKDKLMIYSTLSVFNMITKAFPTITTSELPHSVSFYELTFSFKLNWN